MPDSKSRALIEHSHPKECKGRLAVVYNKHCLYKHNDAAGMAHHGEALP